MRINFSLISIPDIFVPNTDGEMKNTVVCQGKNHTLSCTNGSMVLVINKATYERLQPGSIICPYNSNFEKEDTDDKSVGCQEDVTRKVKDVCHKRKTCGVLASKKVLGRPCKGIYKYISIIYACGKYVVRKEMFDGELKRWTKYPFG